ncbi:DUF29 domain-containing protein [Candidatus Synechococcus calcipolaris G9]|uniref:DUF29 domain-containing protein n=1 Tax=Candidatus Synechococcus calcipolaris G9 TaxID=1497997 RepID=A0ABT6F0Y3_9SYNE|nr:DUF29 domain-containing protein [Candidatus Synechococcus calcipolaris]MDG2991438.1 DUF29 domain-containing protein [Candidatus Synechococcus calcipolaris G9]
MVTQISSTPSKDLYHTDYHLWILATVDSLKHQNIDPIDWQYLIDEVEDLSRRLKQTLKSLLRKLWEHLLKLTYWHSEIEKNNAHWKAENRNVRKQIKDKIQDSPSLKPYGNTTLN